MSAPPNLEQRMAEHRAQREASRGQLYVLEIPTAVIVGAVLGKLVDDHFGCAPWGFAVFLTAGVGASIRAVLGVIRWQKSLSTGEPAIDTDDLTRTPIEREGQVDEHKQRGEP